MNKPVIFLAGLCLAGAGAAGGYFYAKKQLHDEYEERLNDETEKLREKYYKIGVDREDDVKARMVELQETKEYLEDMITFVKKRHNIGDIYEDMSIFRANNEEPEHTDIDEYIPYEKISKEDKDCQDEAPNGPWKKSAVAEKLEEERKEVEEEVDDIIANLPDDEEQDEPYFITDQMFFDNVYDNDQTSVSYFPVDDLVVDDHDSILDNTDFLFGDLLDSLDRDHEDVYYIRNNGRKLDIEVLIVKSSFEEVVGGF